MNCQICNVEFKDIGSVMKHVFAKHKEYTKKAYYDMFLRTEFEGICECGKETTFRGAGRGYLKFCSPSCYANNDKTRAYRSSKATGKKQSALSIQKRIANTDQQKKEETRKTTTLDRYGVNNPSLIPGFIDKVRNTCMTKYGTRSPTQRMNSSHGKWKRLLLNGRTFRVQGYEDVFLSRIDEFGFSLQSIIQGRKNCPTIPWFDENGVEHVYFPDFYIPDENLIIEIKSVWTYKNNKDVTMKKLQAAECLGYKTLCIIFSSRNDKHPEIIK